MGKILDVRVRINYSGSGYIMAGDFNTSAGYQASASFDATNVNVINHATDSENILSKAFTAFITYEE